MVSYVKGKMRIERWEKRDESGFKFRGMHQLQDLCIGQVVCVFLSFNLDLDNALVSSSAFVYSIPSACNVLCSSPTSLLPSLVLTLPAPALRVSAERPSLTAGFKTIPRFTPCLPLLPLLIFSFRLCYLALLPSPLKQTHTYHDCRLQESRNLSVLFLTTTPMPDIYLVLNK